MVSHLLMESSHCKDPIIDLHHSILASFRNLKLSKSRWSFFSRGDWILLLDFMSEPSNNNIINLHILLGTLALEGPVKILKEKHMRWYVIGANNFSLNLFFLVALLGSFKSSSSQRQGRLHVLPHSPIVVYIYF